MTDDGFYDKENTLNQLNKEKIIKQLHLKTFGDEYLIKVFTDKNQSLFYVTVIKNQSEIVSKK